LGLRFRFFHVRKTPKTAQEKKIIINSYKKGLSIETIAEITDLLPEKITEIINRHGL
jgi:hypothetical protein